MATSPFPGYPPFLEVASEQIGRPEAAAPASRIHSLAALSNLCAQAIVADQDRVSEILAKAEEFSQQLEAASIAGKLMLGWVRERRGCSQIEEPSQLSNLAPLASRTRSAQARRRPSE